MIYDFFREFQSRRPGRTYVATDQYPGPPIDGQVRQLGNTRLPSYNKAVRHQGRNCRTPPPDYPKNPYQGLANNILITIQDKHSISLTGKRQNHFM